MVSVTIPKEEYEELRNKAQRYEYLRQILVEDIFSPPPTHNTKEVMKAFRAAKKYNGEFLESLAKGLKRSSYFK